MLREDYKKKKTARRFDRIFSIRMQLLFGFVKVLMIVIIENAKGELQFFKSFS